VDTTGSSAGYDPQPATTAPEDWRQHSLVQVEGGFIGGLALGLVPFGSVIAGAIAGPGSRWAEIGRGVGEVFGGGIAFAAGMAGILGGGAASTTGVLTVPGVLVAVGSAALVTGGIANVKAGAERLANALSMSSGSGSSGPHGTPTTKGGDPGTRPSQPFTKAGKEEVWNRNAAKNGGTHKCEGCDTQAVKPQQHTRGVRPPGNEGHVDHMKARSKGGSGTPDNGQLLCRECNLEKSNK
jgi:hypothetical protein